jgi:transcriptional regulator with XRE-family HTH domain
MHPETFTAIVPVDILPSVSRTVWAKHIRDLREARGWTQEVIAKRAGVKQPVYSKWEKGKAVPQLAKLTRLAAGFGIDLSEAVLGLVPEYDAMISESSAEKSLVLDAGTKGRVPSRHGGVTTSAHKQDGADAAKPASTRGVPVASLESARATLTSVADALADLLEHCRSELARTVPRSTGAKSKRGGAA